MKARPPGGAFEVSAADIEPFNVASPGHDQFRWLVVPHGVPNAVERTIVHAGSIDSGLQGCVRTGRIAQRASAAVSSSRLCAEGVGKCRTLAGRVTEMTAHGLLTGVSWVLRLA
jgi:hypothetical protein